jgi:hypothetical protein
MAESSGFFRSVSGDRKYTVDFLARWVASIIGNGVYDGTLTVTPGDHMQVIIPDGKAWINGYNYRNDGDLTLAIANADGVLHRKDTVVLRWDVNERSITAQILQGTPASNPIAPAIVRTAEQYDLKIAEISIPAGTTDITQALITDTRLDNSVCGIVTGVVKQVDTTALYNQIQSDLADFKVGSEADFAAWSAAQQADFVAWYEGIKDILDESTAGNLLNMIQTHIADGVAHVTQADHDKIDNAAAKSSLTTATLTAAGWTGSALPYSQTISVSGVTVTSVNEILPGASITADQLEALQAANLQDGGQAAGSITVSAWGDKPTIDLPIRIIIRGDM